MWSAVLMSLGGLPLDKINKEKGIIKTGWVEGFSERKARSVVTNRLLDDYWKERYRITFRISGNNLISSVNVSCQVQEKSKRWQCGIQMGEEKVYRRARRRGFNKDRRNS